MAQHEENQHLRSDSPESLEYLLQRGRLLMQALTNKAQAAKLEAERVELQLALDDARSGQPGRLQHLVSIDDYRNRVEPRHSTRERVAAANESAHPALGINETRTDAVDPQGIEDPWLELRQHALRRLELRQVDNAAGTKPADLSGSQRRSTAVPSDLNLRPNSATESQSTEFSPQQRAQQIASGTAEPARQASAPKLPDRQPNSKPPAGAPLRAKRARTLVTGQDKGRRESELAGIAQSFDVRCKDLQQTTTWRTLSRRLGGGLGFSTIIHVLIVICLAIYHLQAPETTAGLAFESSPIENQNQPIEFSQTAEAPEPEAEQALEPLPAESRDFEQELADSSQLINDTSLAAPATLSSSVLTNPALASQSAALLSNASASFFGVASGGNNFCYVVDTSGSMRGQPWEAAKRELLRSLSSLKAKQRFYIIFVGKDFEAIPAPGGREPSTHMLYATGDNLEHARRWIESTKVGSGSPPNDALEFAISKEPDAIYLLTDGVTKVDVCGFLRRVNRIDDVINGERVRVPIHAIAFFSLAGQDLMRRIASENEGQFIYVPNPRKK